MTEHKPEPWDNICTTSNQFTSEDFTVESIKAAMDKMKKLVAEKTYPDVFLTTYDIEERLKDYLSKQDGGIMPRPTVIPINTMYGIIIESYPTKHDCRLRALELQDQGKTFQFIFEGET